MNKIKRLKLSRETLRTLSPLQLGAAVGGMNGTWNCTAKCNPNTGDDTGTAPVYTNTCIP